MSKERSFLRPQQASIRGQRTPRKTSMSVGYSTSSSIVVRRDRRDSTSRGGTSLSKAYGLIQRFSEDIDIGIYKADLNVPLEADIAALKSVNQQQKVLAEQVDEAARQYISGPLRELLSTEIADVEKSIDRAGHFSLSFGFDAYRKKEAPDVLVVGYKSVFDTSGGYVEAAVRIEGGARPDPVPAEPRHIVPYVASMFAAESDLSVSNVMTVKPERIFGKRSSFCTR